ncbi:MAG: hypothetical protein KGL39_32250 [Patescibacteria group bacterium]|nr:hypothetical protein [Patescibacteria group bacterium]
MSFLYPHTIAITRAITNNFVGNIGYSGEQPSQERTIVQKVTAAIQYAGKGKTIAGLPGDVPSTFWRILVPLALLANGTVQTRDIVTDEAGVRYVVISPNWTSLGYQMGCERLET